MPAPQPTGWNVTPRRRPGRQRRERAVRPACDGGFPDQLGLNLRGWDGVRYLYFDANNARVVAESSDTTVRSDPTFTVLEDCGCPAVLVEEGFITNASDRRRPMHRLRL